MLVNIDIDPRWFPPRQKKGLMNFIYILFYVKPIAIECPFITHFSIYLKYKIYFLKCIT